MPAVESAEPQASIVEPEIARPYAGSYEPAAPDGDALEMELDPEFELDLAEAPDLDLDPEFELDLAPEPEPAFSSAPGSMAQRPSFNSPRNPEPELDLDPEFERSRWNPSPLLRRHRSMRAADPLRNPTRSRS